MKQNNKNADQPAHADEDIILEAQTLRRLESIRKADENCDKTITRLLDNAIENVPIEKILTDLLNRFDDAVNINVDLVSQYENPGKMIISVHTGEVGLEENINMFNGTEVRAVIESQAGEQFCLPFDVIATCDGPKRETLSTTPVYMTDSVFRVDPITLEEGLNQLRAKIGKSTDELQELVHDHIERSSD